ncbi:MAG: flagellar basal body P-ring protein FlgI, partial [Novosphingobium sp.]|nr:flagellar basal body P-ring protein FlgI [Novosphingobium sp.]
LNKLGVTPSDLVAILEALKQAGALRAEMEII